MNNNVRVILFSLSLLLTGAGSQAQAFSGETQPRFMEVGATTRPPLGWVDFCAENARECAVAPAVARDAVWTKTAWKQLLHINTLVNDGIQPATDMDHYGVIERWTYPVDGYGDCEDYALLKQKLLIEAGWPRQALLLTVVRDGKGEGHAVLIAKTDRGEFVLDNQNEDVLPWSETEYRFVKRQSQSDPNVWVSLGEARPAPATASSR